MLGTSTNIREPYKHARPTLFSLSSSPWHFVTRGSPKPSNGSVQTISCLLRQAAGLVVVVVVSESQERYVVVWPRTRITPHKSHNRTKPPIQTRTGGRPNGSGSSRVGTSNAGSLSCLFNQLPPPRFLPPTSNSTITI